LESGGPMMAAGVLARRGLPRLGVLLLLLGQFGCVREESTSCSDPFSAKLSRVDRSNTSLVDLEGFLGLPPPIDVRWPSFENPMWWFAYLVDGYRVEIGANAEHVHVGEDISDRSQFYYTGYFWVAKAESLMRRKTDAWGRFSKAQEVGVDIHVYKPFRRYFNSLDMTRKVTISQIQRELNLGQAYLVERPAFVEPMWWFWYEHDGYILRMAANEGIQNIPAGQESRNPDSYFFTGYWACGRRLP
jgi:hypothetical protein